MYLDRYLTEDVDGSGDSRRPERRSSLYVIRLLDSRNAGYRAATTCQSGAASIMTLNGADRKRSVHPSLRVLCFVAGLLLFLVAPVWLGTAYYVNVHAVPKQSSSHARRGGPRRDREVFASAVVECRPLRTFISRAPFLVVLSTRGLSGDDMDQAVITRARQCIRVAKRGRLDLGEWVCLSCARSYGGISAMIFVLPLCSEGRQNAKREG